MQDPSPENIMGQKRHTLKWEINVAHTVAAVLALYLAWKFFGGLSSSEEDPDGEDWSENLRQLSEDAATVAVE